MANMQEVVQVGWQQLRAYFTQTHVQSSIRGTGAALTFILVVVNTPSWLLRAGRISPLLAFNLMILLILALAQLWKKYGGDLNVTALRAVLFMVQVFNMLREEFLVIATTGLDPLSIQRKRRNRKVLRLFIFFLLAQTCIMPQNNKIFGAEFSWAHSLLAFKFLSDCYAFIFYGLPLIRTRNDENDNVWGRGFLSNHVVSFLQICKGLVGANILFYQYFYLSKVYFITTALYFALLDRILAKPLTKCLEFWQFDFFEGLEQYFVTALLAFFEIVLCFVFTLLVLFENKQYLMLIALYTNIYSACREFIRESFGDVFLEWARVAQFERASKEELKMHDDVCAICLMPMKTARKTPCNHFFHGHCLRRALKEKSVCPMCTSSINRL